MNFSEAVSALMRYNDQVLKLDKIVAAAAVENRASNKILRKAGFTPKRKFLEMGMPHFYYENW
jgi:RimJ/RimL family protein N-acetyltransferase